jgi:hypothetical protein
MTELIFGSPAGHFRQTVASFLLNGRFRPRKILDPSSHMEEEKRGMNQRPDRLNSETSTTYANYELETAKDGLTAKARQQTQATWQSERCPYCRG